MWEWHIGCNLKYNYMDRIRRFNSRRALVSCINLWFDITPKNYESIHLYTPTSAKQKWKFNTELKGIIQATLHPAIHYNEWLPAVWQTFRTASSTVTLHCRPPLSSYTAILHCRPPLPTSTDILHYHPTLPPSIAVLHCHHPLLSSTVALHSHLPLLSNMSFELGRNIVHFLTV